MIMITTTTSVLIKRKSKAPSLKRYIWCKTRERRTWINGNNPNCFVYLFFLIFILLCYSFLRFFNSTTGFTFIPLWSTHFTRCYKSSFSSFAVTHPHRLFIFLIIYWATMYWEKRWRLRLPGWLSSFSLYVRIFISSFCSISFCLEGVRYDLEHWAMM